jgi:polar amino acid transport system substrate-binding protein
MKFLIINSPCYIGFCENEPALMTKLNAIIDEAKADGALNAISQNWPGPDLPEAL